MGITFDNEALFDSGSAQIEAGGRSLRHATQPGLGGAGERVFGQGTEARALIQRGVLIADTVEQLQAQVDAIEEKFDGVPRVLVDELDRTWPNVVMTKFEPEKFERIGTRWKVAYRIEYVQAHG